MSKPKVPLKCCARNGVLIIEVDSVTLAFATENHPNYWDPEQDKNTLKVSNKRTWLKSIVDTLNKEEEDGLTMASKMLDDAIAEAVEQGEEGLEETP